jgi:hypothetical protein
MAAVSGLSWVSIREPTTNAADASSNGGRVPRLPTMCPETGAKTRIMAAIGNRYRPAASGERSRTFCR